mmetsp:Transcript_9831/g.19604  ORF Transcript_9831/g.19604 Transcript_9831/m.19604 type:complete len:198 (+) Transcript_9831:128-721(+)
MSTPNFKLNAEGLTEEEQKRLLESVTVVENFPRPGLAFKDLSTVLGDAVAFQAVVNTFVKRYAARGVTAVVGIESRGYCFAAPVALELGVPFVPFRKPGKLPCKSVGVDFNLGGWNKSAAFGSDRLEMREDGMEKGSKVLIIDDMLGTGATLIGACALVERVESTVVECACVVDLKGLQGRDRLKCPFFILIEDAEA